MTARSAAVPFVPDPTRPPPPRRTLRHPRRRPTPPPRRHPPRSHSPTRHIAANAETRRQHAPAAVSPAGTSANDRRRRRRVEDEATPAAGAPFAPSLGDGRQHRVHERIFARPVGTGKCRAEERRLARERRAAIPRRPSRKRAKHRTAADSLRFAPLTSRTILNASRRARISSNAACRSTRSRTRHSAVARLRRCSSRSRVVVNAAADADSASSADTARSSAVARAVTRRSYLSISTRARRAKRRRAPPTRRLGGEFASNAASSAACARRRRSNSSAKASRPRQPVHHSLVRRTTWFSWGYETAREGTRGGSDDRFGRCSGTERRAFAALSSGAGETVRTPEFHDTTGGAAP